MKLRRLRLLLLVPLAIGLEACPLGDAVQSVSSSTPMGDAIKMDEQGMWAVETIYNVPAQAYVSADTRGVLPANVKAIVRPWLIELRRLLLDVRAAYAIGDAATFNARIAAMQQLKARIMARLPAAN